MTVVWRSSSAGMLVPVTVHVSAATLLVACVDSVPPVPGRAGKLRSSTDDTGSRERARSCGISIDSTLKQAHGVRLTHRSHRQKAAGRHACELQVALTMDPNRGSGWPIIHRAFHYVNSHPRGDPVYSLLNDI